MTTSCDIFEIFTLELSSPTFSFPFVFAVTILLDLTPLVVLLEKGLVEFN
jgi:hypothetical protein